MLFQTQHHRLGHWLLSCLCMLLFNLPAQADFALNFRPNTTNTNNDSTDQNGYLGSDNDQGNSCGIDGYDDSGCFWFRSPADTKFNVVSQQPFRMEHVVGDDGNYYWHLLLGNADDDWKQDVWIRQTEVYDYMQHDGGGSKYQWTTGGRRSALSDSGGFASMYNDNKNQTGSGYGQMNKNDQLESELYAGNGVDTLRADSQWTGNGTGDPTRVIIRQIDNSNGAYQEFLKDDFNKKPLIYQEVNTADINLVFQVDMRGMDYNTSRALTVGTSTVTRPVNPAVPGNGNSTGYSTAPTNSDYAYNAASEFVLQMDITGNSGTGASFDAAGERPVAGGSLLQQNVTAGQYTWAAGNGWIASTAGDTYYSVYYPTIDSSQFTKMPIYQAGTYTYANGAFDHENQAWKELVDLTQSPCGGDPFCPTGN